ncbi:MAG: hypothetical protein ACOX9B_01935 [Candidatus Xenobium sp.]|jgi:hypothetical protein|nr:hypothetical protein [Burkholderiales bacterium]
MNINTSLNFGYNQGTGSRAQVNPQFLRALESKGFRKPVRSLADPRLRLPELLLIDGWERQAISNGVIYRAVAKDDSDYGQQITLSADNAREVRTFTENGAHVLRVDAKGQVKEYQVAD